MSSDTTQVELAPTAETEAISVAKVVAEEVRSVLDESLGSKLIRFFGGVIIDKLTINWQASIGLVVFSVRSMTIEEYRIRRNREDVTQIVTDGTKLQVKKGAGAD